MYLFIDLSSTEPVVSKLLVGFLFDLRRLEIYSDDDDDDGDDDDGDDDGEIMWYDMIFIYCSWVSARWQWSVNLCKNGKETAQKEKEYMKQYKNAKCTK